MADVVDLVTRAREARRRRHGGGPTGPGSPGARSSVPAWYSGSSTRPHVPAASDWRRTARRPAGDRAVGGRTGSQRGACRRRSWPTAAPQRPDSRSRRKVGGGLLGASLCAPLFVASLTALAYVIAGLNPQGPYFLLGLTWWLPVAVGSGLSFARKGGLASAGRPGPPRRADRCRSHCSRSPWPARWLPGCRLGSVHLHRVDGPALGRPNYLLHRPLG